MKRNWIIGIICWLTLTVSQAQTVGLVMSGGGAKGAAHIGVIKALEEKHILSTILFLGENGVTSKTTLYENVSKNPRMPDKLCELEKVGLLNVRSGYPTSIELTSKGKAVYEFLREIEDIV